MFLSSFAGFRTLRRWSRLRAPRGMATGIYGAKRAAATSSLCWRVKSAAQFENLLNNVVVMLPFLSKSYITCLPGHLSVGLEVPVSLSDTSKPEDYPVSLHPFPSALIPAHFLYICPFVPFPVFAFRSCLKGPIAKNVVCQLLLPCWAVSVFADLTEMHLALK